jgi:hypothetical protein
MSDDASVLSYEGIENNDIVNYKNDDHATLLFTLRTTYKRGIRIMIPDTSPTVENWMELGRFIGGSKSIECLQISLDGLDEVEDEIAIAGTENLEAFISSVANNRSLKDLWLDEYDFSRARLSILHPFVIENDNLVSLSLHSCNFGLMIYKC